MLDIVLLFVYIKKNSVYASEEYAIVVCSTHTYSPHMFNLRRGTSVRIYTFSLCSIYVRMSTCIVIAVLCIVLLCTCIHSRNSVRMYCTCIHCGIFVRMKHLHACMLVRTNTNNLRMTLSLVIYYIIINYIDSLLHIICKIKYIYAEGS